jgi:hypothetical protein
VELIRETLVRLTWKGDRICAMLGIDFQEDRAGFGFTVPEALRELAAQIDRRDITVWVQRPARPYREGEAVKVACPELVGTSPSSRTSIVLMVSSVLGAFRALISKTRRHNPDPRSSYFGGAIVHVPRPPSPSPSPPSPSPLTRRPDGGGRPIRAGGNPT